MGITPTQIRNINGTILSSVYDNTEFHDYRTLGGSYGTQVRRPGESVQA